MHSHIGPVIVDLIEELEIQLDQEFYSYYKMEHPKEALPMLEPPEQSTAGVEPMNVETNTKTVTANSPSNHVKTKSPISLQVNFHLIYHGNYVGFTEVKNSSHRFFFNLIQLRAQFVTRTERKKTFQ